MEDEKLDQSESEKTDETVNQETEVEAEVVEEEVEEVEEDFTPPAEEPAPDEKLKEAYQGQKVRAEKAEAENKELEKKLNKVQQKESKDGSPLDVEDYIDISASLEGLDQREKEYLAEQHKLSGKSLTDIRSSEDYKLWQSAYRTKVEKERALAPSGTQTDEQKKVSLKERLANASLADQETILIEQGLYKPPKGRKKMIPMDGYKNT